MAPFAAAFIQRYGQRAVVAVAMVLIVAGLALATRIDAVWQLWMTWGLLVGVGTGLTALVLGATVAANWFATRRGLVLGLLTASSATGQLALFPLATWMAETYGWRSAVLPSGIACAVAGVLVMLFACDHPAQLGLPAVGERIVAAIPPRRGGAATIAISALREASATRSFWLLFGTFFVCGLSTNGLIQHHFIPLCSDYGMVPLQAAWVLTMMGLCDFIGTIGSGWLSDRYDSRLLLCWYYGLRGLSLMVLPFSTFSIPGLTLFAVFYGLDWIATVPPTVKLAAANYGRQRSPVVFGWIYLGHQLGAATAAAAGGVSKEQLASYLPAFFFAGVACLFAAAASLLIRRPKPPATLIPLTAGVGPAHA